MPKDSPRIRGTNPQTEQAARLLRQVLTPAEIVENLEAALDNESAIALSLEKGVEPIA